MLADSICAMARTPRAPSWLRIRAGSTSCSTHAICTLPPKYTGPAASRSSWSALASALLRQHAAYREARMSEAEHPRPAAVSTVRRHRRGDRPPSRACLAKSEHGRSALRRLPGEPWPPWPPAQAQPGPRQPTTPASAACTAAAPWRPASGPSLADDATLAFFHPDPRRAGARTAAEDGTAGRIAPGAPGASSACTTRPEEKRQGLRLLPQRAHLHHPQDRRDLPRRRTGEKAKPTFRHARRRSNRGCGLPMPFNLGARTGAATPDLCAPLVQSTRDAARRPLRAPEEC
ncbi:MAG: hypothetical protein ACLTDR_04965 [Adlercreutzia equolifaciens]